LKLVIFFVTSVCNAKCRTCFYWEELNQRGDLTWDEIQKLSGTMPRFTDLWLSGGEPMLRRELADILHLFYANNGIRWVNLPTNGLLPARTAEQAAKICTDNPKLQLDINVAMDGLYGVQDSIRSVPGNFEKTLNTLEALQPCRDKFTNLRVNINTVICAENFDSVLEIGRFVRQNCRVDGHYFNIIRGSAKDPTLKRIPTERLPALYGQIRKIYAHYARIATRHHGGLVNHLGRAYYEGVLAFHNKVQLDNVEAPHAWPMPCTASESSIVIDHNGDVRACELRGRLGSLRDFDCDFRKFWDAEARRNEPAAIARDQCWCTHVCFIHDSLRHSPKALLYDVPLSYLQSKLFGISNGDRPDSVL
ncbi:MAG TPA: radical SAM protein, partial [Terriglobia bacterium]|nr:radical SAM protein [Terriglobia bacterium]